MIVDPNPNQWHQKKLHKLSLKSDEIHNQLI